MWRLKKPAQNNSIKITDWSVIRHSSDGWLAVLKYMETLWNTVGVFNLWRTRMKTLLFWRLWCCSSNGLDTTALAQVGCSNSSAHRHEVTVYVLGGARGGIIFSSWTLAPQWYLWLHSDLSFLWHHTPLPELPPSDRRLNGLCFSPKAACADTWCLGAG